jgi:hypothetical protein
LDLNGHSSTDQCHEYREKWFDHFDSLGSEVALLNTESYDRYFNTVGPKTRNMIRKSNKLCYYYEFFNFNDELDSMFEVNTSVAERQGQPMTAAYLTKPKPISGLEPCALHQQVYIGGFYEGRLVAYCWLAMCNEVAVINRILGHADHQSGTGLMDGLVNELVKVCSRNEHVNYLSYRTLTSTTKGLEKFKKNVGFRSVNVRVLT